MSDNVRGNFGVDFGKALTLARTKEEIDRAYSKTLEEFETENKRIVDQTEQSLFTSFTKNVADRVTIISQYIKEEVDRINDNLWAVVSWFFEAYNTSHESGFEIDYANRIVTARICFTTGQAHATSRTKA